MHEAYRHCVPVTRERANPLALLRVPYAYQTVPPPASEVLAVRAQRKREDFVRVAFQRRVCACFAFSVLACVGSQLGKSRELLASEQIPLDDPAFLSRGKQYGAVF